MCIKRFYLYNPWAKKYILFIRTVRGTITVAKVFFSV